MVCSLSLCNNEKIKHFRQCFRLERKNKIMRTSLYGSKTKLSQYIPLVFTTLMLLSIGRDLIHAFLKNYNFYWSEALLFETFWLLFAPFVLIIYKMKNCQPQWFYLILFPLLFTFIHLITFSLLVHTISALFFYHTFDAMRLFIDGVSDHSMVGLVIYGGATLLFFKSKKEADEGLKKKIPSGEAPSGEISNKEISKTTSQIRVKHQQQTILIPVHDILYITTNRPYIALVTQSKTYLHNSNLKTIKEQHLTDNFIQIHKSTIINTDFISTYTSRKNGDYDVVMSNGDTVRASRNYNAYFKTFNKNSG